MKDCFPVCRTFAVWETVQGKTVHADSSVYNAYLWDNATVVVFFLFCIIYINIKIGYRKDERKEQVKCVADRWLSQYEIDAAGADGLNVMGGEPEQG